MSTWWLNWPNNLDQPVFSGLDEQQTFNKIHCILAELQKVLKIAQTKLCLAQTICKKHVKMSNITAKLFKMRQSMEKGSTAVNENLNGRVHVVHIFLKLCILFKMSSLMKILTTECSLVKLYTDLDNKTLNSQVYPLV